MSRCMPERLSRMFLVSTLVLSGCGEINKSTSQSEVPLLPTATVIDTDLGLSPVGLTPKAKQTTHKILTLEREVNLPSIVDGFPVFDADDPYYPWYRCNGGEKLFEPLMIPARTKLITPKPEEEPSFRLAEITSSPEEWQHQLAFNVTSLEGSSAARMQNMETAVKNLNGIIVEPFRLFSMNEALEPFTEEEGYTMGWGYTLEGEVPMFAGGICQLPSTLFKPALEAGMLIVSRHAHLYYSSRYEIWDATISESLDFTFRNLYDFPIQIRAEIQGQDLVMGIWSPEMIPYDQVNVEVLYNWLNDDGSREAAVKQVIVWGGRERVRDYYSHYIPKPTVSKP